MKKIKENDIVWALYVNMTSFYTSFKIEEGKYLGEIERKKRLDDKHIHVVEHYDDELNFLAIDDIFKSEADAEKYLAKILTKKYEKK
jgi:hypothetical protein